MNFGTCELQLLYGFSCSSLIIFLVLVLVIIYQSSGVFTKILLVLVIVVPKQHYRSSVTILSYDVLGMNISTEVSS